MEQALELLKPLLETYSSLLPAWLVGLLAIIGTLRLIVKPALALAYAIVQATPSKSDDEAVAKVEQSKVFKALLFVLDWLASVKLPSKK